MQHIENEGLNPEITSAYGANPSSNVVSTWNGVASSNYALPSGDSFLRSFPHVDAALESRPGMSSAPEQAVSAAEFMETNFNTEDANLLDFFRYGLAQWPDSTNVWPPINDFGTLGGSPLDGTLPRHP